MNGDSARQFKSAKNRPKGKIKQRHILPMQDIMQRRLSRHIDYLQVKLLRNRLKQSQLTLNETISIHQQDREDTFSKDNISRNKSLDKEYSTCAIVGNSDILLGSKCGAEIDAHDFVMRSNMAPTHNYRRHVGNRTDFMAVHQVRFLEIARCTQNKNNPCYAGVKQQLLSLGKANMWIIKHGGINPKSFDQIAKFAKHNAQDLTFSYPNLKYYRTTISSFWGFNVDISSNGLLLSTVAIPMCKKISLYGFNVSSKDAYFRNSYFSKSPLQEVNIKNTMQYELRQIKELNSTKVLRLVSMPCQ
ncbi:alpha-2,8-sialyltransferase 8B-like isoform X2 [Antedon mediterranea]